MKTTSTIVTALVLLLAVIGCSTTLNTTADTTTTAAATTTALPTTTTTATTTSTTATSLPSPSRDELCQEAQPVFHANHHPDWHIFEITDAQPIHLAMNDDVLVCLAQIRKNVGFASSVEDLTFYCLSLPIDERKESIASRTPDGCLATLRAMTTIPSLPSRDELCQEAQPVFHANHHPDWHIFEIFAVRPFYNDALVCLAQVRKNTAFSRSVEDWNVYCLSLPIDERKGSATASTPEDCLELIRGNTGN